MTTVLESTNLRLEFDREAGGLTAIANKLTGETYSVAGDTFAVETTSFRRVQAQMTRVEWAASAHRVTARYADVDLDVEVDYELRLGDDFFQKRLAVTFAESGGVTQIVVSRPVFTARGLQIVCYRHPDFDWVTDYVKEKHGWELRRPEGSEPARTFFGRTASGGFCAGIEMPYDNSRLDRDELTLGYAPSLKVKARERLECEALYFGVYRRSEQDARAIEWEPISAGAIAGLSVAGGFDGAAAAGLSIEQNDKGARHTSTALKSRPLPSESAAMTKLTSSILGPPRHGLMAFACGWHSQMEQEAYDSDARLEGDLRSLEFCSACGLDGVSDSHPWGGESAQMAALREGDHYTLGERLVRFLERAQELGLTVVQWPTMNNTHPWRTYGGPLRRDRPDWLRGIEGEALGGANADNLRRREANCLACEPYYEWLERTILDDALGTGLYGAWTMDGDFWGTGAYFHSTLPVTCLAENHDHLPGDSNYACQRRLEHLIAHVRHRYPGIYIVMCRPPMDLGIWAQRHVDACFTLIESGTGGSNIAAGDEVRTASRIRVHHHFFPHWLDWSLLFPSYGNPKSYRAWPSAKMDYLLLSALSCSPNLLFYLPTKTGIPEEDKAVIRTWLDWGRANVEYLLVRRDLFDWPGKGVVDGSAHLIGDRGLIFLFNGGATPAVAEFALTPGETGFSGTRPVSILQEFPAACDARLCRPGATVRWDVPPQTAVVLRLVPGQA